MTICADCPKELGRRNKSGKCRSCMTRAFNADPVINAKRRAGIRARFEDPEHRRINAERLAEHLRNMTESERQIRSEKGKLQYEQYLSKPEVRKLALDRLNQPEVRARQGASYSDTMLPWCPRELRPLYRELRAKGSTPQEAREAVELEIPGSLANARRTIANNLDAQRIRHARDVAQSY